MKEDGSDWPLIRFLLKRHMKKKALYYIHEIAIVGFTAVYLGFLMFTGVRINSGMDATVMFTPLMYVYMATLLNLRNQYEDVSIDI